MRKPRRRLLALFAAAIFLLLTPRFPTMWLDARQAPPTHGPDANAPIVVTRPLTNVRLRNAPSVERLGLGAVAPHALAAGDFDEDGVSDLVAGFVAGNVPFVALYPGNGAALDANDAAPFLAPRTLELPLAPEFLTVGDFDADGHLDLALGSRSAAVIAWLPGDGRGTFEAARFTHLPGAVIGMAAGEVHGADGLADLAVSVSGEHGNEVLVFSGSDGALQSHPARIALLGPSGLVLIGHLDDDWFGDVGVLVDEELLIYHGDAGSLETGPTTNRSAQVSRHSLGVHPVAGVAGRFDAADAATTGLAFLDGSGTVRTLMRRRGTRAAWRLSAAGRGSDAIPSWSGPDGDLPPILASATVSASGADDLVVVDRARRRISIVPAGGATAATLELKGAASAILPMRLNGDAVSDLVIFAEGADAPSVLLTAAGRTFVVNVPGDEPDCNITDNVCRIGPVDAKGACTGGCTFRAALNEANVNADLDTIEFALGAGTPRIQKQGGADWIATSPVLINGNTGGATRVHLDAAGMGNTLIVRGGSSAIRNLVITGGSAGVAVTTNGGNIFEGNWIGVDPTGTMAIGNPGQGMLVTAPLNTIGGTTAAARNVISASALNGIEIRNATGNRLLGNFIGTDATGTRDLGNALSGVYLELAGNTTLGGAVAGARNVISGNDSALNGGVFANISPNLVAQGNYIGTTATGNARLGNTGPGLRLASGSNDMIGGTTAAARNVIAGNGGDGLIVRSINVSVKTLIQGNYIGAAANGALLGNGGFGIAIQGTHDTTIGGTASGARNVIGGNGKAGVALQFAGVQPVGNVVRGNSIVSNGGLGIDLGADGVTANDACDADTGANGRQNAPAVTSVSGITSIQGALNSSASTTYVLDFYSSPAGDPSGYGEGHTYVGSKTVTTNPGCTASFTAAFTKPIPIGHVVTATATDPANNTSEFSGAVAVPGAILVSAPNTALNWGIGSVQRVQWSHNLGAGSLVKVEISRDNGATYSVVAASVKNAATNGTYSWTVDGPATGQGRIRVSSLSNPSIADVSNVNFTIAEPFVTVTRPTLASHIWTVGTNQTIQWTNNLGTLEMVTIELSTDGGATFPVVLAASTPSDGTHAVVVQPGWATASARVRVTWLKNTAVSDSSDQNFAVQ